MYLFYTFLMFFLSRMMFCFLFFFFSSRRRHTRFDCDWSSDVCSSDLMARAGALYMVEHVDFLGGDPAIPIAAAPLVKALAEASQKEAGALRYDIYRQPPPRINHYEVVAVWTDAKAFDAHETATHTLQFRAATAQGGRAWRANLYDQRLYKVL